MAANDVLEQLPEQPVGGDAGDGDWLENGGSGGSTAVAISLMALSKVRRIFSLENIAIIYISITNFEMFFVTNSFCSTTMT